MKNCLAKGDKLKAVKVLFAVCIQGIVVYMSCVIDSSFYVTHLLGRGELNKTIKTKALIINSETREETLRQRGRETYSLV